MQQSGSGGTSTPNANLQQAQSYSNAVPSTQLAGGNSVPSYQG